MTENYWTTELELAAFLKARGRRLLGARPEGRLVKFEFDGPAADDVESYFAGAEISARELFEAHRHLRAIIQQLKQHTYQIGVNNNGRSECSHF